MGKRCLHFFSAFLDWILFILAGNVNIHESLDEFEIRPTYVKQALKFRSGGGWGLGCI